MIVVGCRGFVVVEGVATKAHNDKPDHQPPETSTMQSSIAFSTTPSHARFTPSVPFQWHDLRKTESDTRDAELARVVRERTEMVIPSIGASIMCGALAVSALAMFATFALVVASSFGNTSIWELLNSF